MTNLPVPPNLPWFSNRARLVSVPGLSLRYQERISLTRSVAMEVILSKRYSGINIACRYAHAPHRVQMLHDDGIRQRGGGTGRRARSPDARIARVACPPGPRYPCHRDPLSNE